MDLLKEAVDEASKEYENSMALVEKATNAVKNYEHHKVLEFVIQSVNDLLKYKNDPTSYELVTASYVIPNCLVDVVIPTDTGNKFIASLHAAEVITNQSLFEEDSENSVKFRLSFMSMSNQDMFEGSGDNKKVLVTNIRHIQPRTTEAK